MKNERILIADDQEIVMNALFDVISLFGEEDGHAVVGQASSVSEVEGLLKKGLKPTVALVDGNFPNYGDGDKAANIIRRLSPETKIIAFSSSPQKYGDEQWNKHSSAKELVQNLTNLKH
jgi:DNA-binding NarL/FixJ family response regulator